MEAMEVDPAATSSSDLVSKIGNNGEQKNPILVLMIGPPGSGKSTFCEQVMRASARTWVRVCQDTIGNGKAGTRAQCIASAFSALKEGKSVFIDRCNIDREQRADFLKLGDQQVQKHAVVLDLPAKLCISRSVKRTDHEGKLQGGKAAVVVNRVLQKKEVPKLTEGFSRISFCYSEKDVEDEITGYSALGLGDALPPGCFGEKKAEVKAQPGIMKFFKKVDPPCKDGLVESKEKTHSFPSSKATEEKESGSGGLEDHSAPSKDVRECRKDSAISPDSVPTLAFPSISTADFQFDLGKASNIIVEKVEEFSNKLPNARLVLVDLSHGSKILSLVKAKAEQKNINPDKFFTFVGDITRLYSAGGLRCSVIANAANWRLKPGGGGVNAAIYSAAGPELDRATKERASSLAPGKALVVPLTSTSPLSVKEGVTHVIHVLGPNMNPQRPDFLNNDYVKGCKVLREAYSSLFESFATILATESQSSGRSIESSMDSKHDSDHKVKREASDECEVNKKSKSLLEEVRSSLGHSVHRNVNIQSKDTVGSVHDCEKTDASKEDSKDDASLNRVWGSWTQALYQIAMHPEKHTKDIIQTSDDVVVLYDLYPKARKHLLVLSRVEGIDQLANVRKEHFPLLNRMHDVGLKWVEQFLSEDESLVFRLGYHSVPSMRQLHLHVISQDFDSKHLKNKKHWNSFNTPFFRDSVDVMEEVSKQGKAVIKDDSYQSMELRCHRCRSAHPNIPRLKTHVSKCHMAFPGFLLGNDRLVFRPGKAGGV